jgi:hypothetical protein
MYDFFPFHVLPPSIVLGFADQPGRLFRYSPAFLTYREYHIAKRHANSYNEYRDILNPHIRKRSTVLPKLRSFLAIAPKGSMRGRETGQLMVLSPHGASAPPKKPDKQAGVSARHERTVGDSPV